MIGVIVGVFFLAVGISAESDNITTGLIIISAGVAIISLSAVYYLFSGGGK